MTLPLRPGRTARPARRRGWVALLAAGLVLGACADDTPDAAPATSTTAAPTTSTTAVPPTTTSPTSTTRAASTTGATGAPPRRIVALGDSYSAGVGATTPILKPASGCSRDAAASYATLAVATLRAEGRTIDLDLRACDTGKVDDIVSKQADGLGPSEAIVLTLGGNDLGFSRIIAECLGLGCRSYDQPGDRLPGIDRDPARSDWDVLTERVTNGLDRLREKLTPTGTIYVLTYPIPFPARPDETCLANTAPLNAASRDFANAAIDRLDETIIAAATTVNTRAGRPVVQIVEWRTALDAPRRTATDASGVVRQIRDNPNGICGTDPVINGVVRDEFTDSFHPTDRGHRLAADRLVAALGG